MRLSTKEYKKRKETLINNYGVTEKQLTEMLKGDYHDGAGVITSNGIMNQLFNTGKVNKAGVITISDGVGLDDWDFVWYYKRNLHVVLPAVDECTIPVDGVDCTPIAEIDKDIEIDTMLGELEVYIRVIHRNIPINFKSTQCNCSIQVYTEDKMMSYHLELGKEVRKVFLDKSDCCGDCSICKGVCDSTGGTYKLRPRFRPECESDNTIGHPFGILQLCTEVAKVYNNREKLSHQRKETKETTALRSIMVEHHDGDTDTERLMSMYEYVKEYHESVRKEWQGGHHASPVSHPRSGYYRKAKHGTHVLRDGKFVEVSRGMGNFIHVKPTIVNAHKDSVLAEMI